ncbi:hypothetical protein [Streptomyces sp. NPDC048606]|uniref:hypothetical protein n=1 Tax=Streptomyces sp. NPDC048606 TaxID=3154726 RepID=UPI00342FF446
MTSPPRTTPPRVPAADRGALRIADRVIAKIAARAAREALGPTRTPAAGAATLPAPHATVTVHHDIARVHVSLHLPYPDDLAARCAAVRRRVVERVEGCASMSVPEVDIDIEHLRPAGAPDAPAGRERRLR